MNEDEETCMYRGCEGKPGKDGVCAECSPILCRGCYEQEVEGADQGALCETCSRSSNQYLSRRRNQSSDDDDEDLYLGTDKARLPGSEIVKFFTDNH